MLLPAIMKTTSKSNPAQDSQCERSFFIRVEVRISSPKGLTLELTRRRPELVLITSPTPAVGLNELLGTILRLSVRALGYLGNALIKLNEHGNKLASFAVTV